MSAPVSRRAHGDDSFGREARGPFTVQTLDVAAEDIVARDMPDAQKVRVLHAIVREYSRPSRPIIERVEDVNALLLRDPATYRKLLDGYFVLLGASVANADHAIERAENGDTPQAWALDRDFPAHYTTALHEVREERARCHATHEYYDRIAAALLASTRLLDAEGSAAE